MGRIIVSENVTLDGFAEDPDGAEGSPSGGWFMRAADADRMAWADIMLAEARGTTALLLGRRTDEWFAARWQSRGGEWADRLNGLPKYVVSTSTRPPSWSNATLLRGAEMPAEVARLRTELAGDIVVYGSLRLVHALLEHELVDELRLTICPVMLGAGTRLIGTAGGHRPLRLLQARTLGTSLVYLVYSAPTTV